jgi:hypothetical protein
MPDLYTETPCPACGGTHTLFCHDPDRHPHATVYRYTCPASQVVVCLHLTVAPQSVILPPANAVPVSWVSD